MAYTEQYIALLILKHFREENNSLEKKQLENWLSESPQNRLFFEELDSEEDILRMIAAEEEDRENEVGQRLYQEVQKRIHEQEVLTRVAPAAPLRRMRRRLIWYAAAAVLISITFLWLQKEPGTKQPRQTLAATQAADILPGTEKAILTLSNGQQVELSADGNQVINDGELAISNNGGELSYSKSETVIYNTMTTPKGGQFRITLADGSKVWLNAASSIRFPTQFVGAAREVSITGEVYFEVDRNRKMPFVVETPDGTKVEVLGTHFNVKAYGDEAYQTTTLIEGLVKVTRMSHNVQLRAGQQAKIATAQTVKDIDVSDADVEEAMGWRNNLFVFNSADIPEIMRQLSRWYDLEINYKGEVPKTQFKGKIPRDLTLSQVLNALKLAGVNFEINEKTLIVSKEQNK